MELSIIIVNYKNQHLITQCIRSIIDCEKKINYEIIVVDNNSNDDTEKILKEIYAELVWIQMGYNSGFGRACNEGIRRAKGKFLLLLNSDTLIKDENTLYDCAKYLEVLQTVKHTILGVRLVDLSGKYQETLRMRFISLTDILRANPLYIFIFNRILKINKKEKEKQKQKDAHYKSGEVAWINGAFMMMDRNAILQNKLFFDEDYFLYGEDMEFCWRVRKKEFRFYHWHEKELIHIGSGSSSDLFLKRCQITVSDWLTIKKMRGTLYFLVYLVIELFNILADEILFFLAKTRGKKISLDIKIEHKFRSIKWYLLRKYGFLTLTKNKLSTSLKFLTNCYEDSYIKNKK